MSDLPANVCATKDRHGKTRYRFRRKGWPSAYLPGEPGSAEFHRAYAAIIEAGPHTTVAVASPRKVAPRSLDDLFVRMKAGTRWQKKAAKTQHVEAQIIERFLNRKGKSGRRFGDRPVADVSVAWLDLIFAKMADRPGAANKLRKRLIDLMNHAARLGWRADNPASLTESYPSGPGFQQWREDDIAAFRAKHGLGTMARLTLELALNTAARRCDLIRLTRDDLKDGRISVAHAKGGETASIPLLPTTKAALDALPAAPIRHLIVTQFGKPFTVAGMGNRMREWCDDAGLSGLSMHGLRKAVARRIAESGGTDAEGQSVTGQKKSETFTYYRAAANRSGLADNAMINVSAVFDVQPSMSNPMSNPD